MAIDLSDIKTFQDAVVTVMGLGRFKQGSGVGATKWLMRHGAQTVITDLTTEEELKESVDEVMGWYSQYRKDYPDREIYPPVFVLGEHHEDDFTDVDLVVQNPGVPRESKFVQAAKAHGVSVESDISLFFRLCPFPIYAVTGTRGKSTTTALFGEMLKAVYGKAVVAGNIGRSPLEDLDDLLASKERVPIVLELSSWLIESLENVDRSPEIALLTNVYKDHLDRYASFEEYIAAKELMFAHQKPDDIAIINKDQDTTRAAATRVPSRVLWFSLQPLPEGEDGAFVEDGMMVLRVDGERHDLCPVEKLNLGGTHNLQNALAASLGAYMAKLPVTIIAEVLQTFHGLPNRQETVREANGVTFINDTTASTPEGTMAALDRFGKEKQVILLAGGNSKGLSFDELGKKIAETCKHVILMDGNATHDLATAIGSGVPMTTTSSMAEAVEKANALAEEGDVILLSPAATSFNWFKNEFERGASFVDEVKKIPGEI